MTKPIIKTATASDEMAIIDVMMRAFAADAVAQWIWPDSRQYQMYFPSFVRAFGGKAFSHGSAYYIDGYAAAALWLPPGTLPDDDMLNSIFQRACLSKIKRMSLMYLTKWVAIIQTSCIGICRLWGSTRLNRAKDLALH
jgi:hypothetical protein